MQKLTIDLYNKELLELNATTNKAKVIALEYINNTTKTKHKCLDCKHEFLIEPKVMKLGKHCPNCGTVKNQKMDHATYLNKLSLVNKTNERKILPKETFINTTTKIKHKCYACNYKWLATPKDLLAGNGCPNCYKNNSHNATKYKEFLETKNIKLLSTYKYSSIVCDHECLNCSHTWKSKPNYIIAKNIGCPECHKQTKQKSVSDYLKNNNILDKFKLVTKESEIATLETYVRFKCLKCNTPKTIRLESVCRYENNVCNNCQTQKRTKKFIKQSKKLFENKFDYSNVKVTNKEKQVKLICKEHGKFYVNAGNHLTSVLGGCPKCINIHLSKKYSDTTESYINKAIKIHKDKYDYSKVNYVNSSSKIIVGCKIHGDFNVRAGAHLRGNGCAECSLSLQTSKVEKLIFNYVKKYCDNVVENDRTALDGKEIDIYLPDQKLGFEINGLYYHRESKLGQLYHRDKANLAKSKGITLIQFWENEIHSNFSIIKSFIKNKLGLSKSIYARKLIVRKISNKRASKFLEKNHLQGTLKFSKAYGLLNDKKLLSVMTFNKPRSNNWEWELSRFVTKRGYNVVGGASKLLSRFRKTNKGSIVSYADRRISEGKLYHALGFKLLQENRPNYFYFKGSKVFSKYQFARKNLSKRLDNFDTNLSERQNMQNHGYHRVYDAGKLVFVLD